MNVGEPKSAGSVMTNQVNGMSQIFVENAEGRKMKHPSSLFFYDGVTKSGTQNENLKPIPVTILCFKETKTAAQLYDQLAKFDHPGIIEAFSCGTGQGNHSGHSFLAITKFETTFEGYFRKECQWAFDQQKRFTQEFIKLLRDLIVAMEELHKQDYYCPKLDGSHIAVVNEGNAERVKLWRFGKIKADTDSGKNLSKANDWFRLGRKIRNVSLTKESTDLVERISRGDLKGRDILRHYALLTVREKFENILSLNQHISLNWKRTPKKQELLEVSNLCLETLKEDLDKTHTWKSPRFIDTQSDGSTKTLRGFIHHLRTIIEHEVRYLTPEFLAGVETDLKDLEHYFQQWEVYRKLLWIAVELRLKY